MKRHLDSPIDCVVRVVTPENVSFDYALAGPFQRFGALCVDLIVKFGICFALFILLIFLGLMNLVSGFAVALFGVSVFLISWFYSAFMEALFNGRTLGKMSFKLRVISSDGRPIGGVQALLRNLLQVADLFPPLTFGWIAGDGDGAVFFPSFLFGLISMAMTPRLQRLGDLAAGTMVVSDRQRGISTNIQPEDSRAFSLAELIPPSFPINRSLARVVGLYMERRRLLHPQRRNEIAGRLAKPLLLEFELPDNTNYDLFMCALYVRIFHSQRQSTSVGKLPEPQLLTAAFPSVPNTRPPVEGLIQTPSTPSRNAPIITADVVTAEVVTSEIVTGEVVENQLEPINFVADKSSGDRSERL